jgi:hypothetical protein
MSHHSYLEIEQLNCIQLRFPWDTDNLNKVERKRKKRKKKEKGKEKHTYTTAS